MGRLNSICFAVFIVFFTAAPAWLDNLNKKMDNLGEKVEQSSFVQRMDEKLGGWSGEFDRRLNRVLGRDDQDDLHDAVEETVSQADATSHRREWRSEQSTATATIRTSALELREESAQQKTIESVVIDGRMIKNTTQLQSVRASNVRYGPGTKYNIVRSIPPGTPLWSIAQTRNGWYLLEQDGVAYGYVHQNLVTRESSASPLDSYLESGSSDAGDDEIADVIDLNKQDIGIGTLKTQSECRDVSVDLNKEGQREYDEFVVCKDARGAWHL